MVPARSRVGPVPRLHRCVSSLPRVELIEIVGRSALEARHQDAEEPIGHAAQCAGVAMSSLAQGLVVLVAEGIALGGHPGPVIHGVAQADVARPPNLDDPRLVLRFPFFFLSFPLDAVTGATPPWRAASRSPAPSPGREPL